MTTNTTTSPFRQTVLEAAAAVNRHDIAEIFDTLPIDQDPAAWIFDFASEAGTYGQTCTSYGRQVLEAQTTDDLVAFVEGYGDPSSIPA